MSVLQNLSFNSSVSSRHEAHKEIPEIIDLTLDEDDIENTVTENVANLVDNSNIVADPTTVSQSITSSVERVIICPPRFLNNTMNRAIRSGPRPTKRVFTITLDSDEEEEEMESKRMPRLPRESPVKRDQGDISESKEDVKENLLASLQNPMAPPSSQFVSLSASKEDVKENLLATLQDPISSSPIPPSPLVPPPTLPPSMAKQKDPRTYDYMLWFCDHMKNSVSNEKMNNLRHSTFGRLDLYNRYVEEGLLNSSDRSTIEQLPIYVSLMPQKTQKAYLDSWKVIKMATGGNLHELIFNVSLENDDDVAEVIEEKTLGSLNAKEVRSALESIGRGGNWRNDLIGVLEVKKVEDVPDGGYLACFEKIPNIQTIRDKHLTCVVIKPSLGTVDLVNSLYRTQFTHCLKRSAIGRGHCHLCFQCFGPRVQEAIRQDREASDSLAEVFHLAEFNSIGKIMRQIYVVHGFF